MFKNNKPPMTADEAREIIAEMQARTKPDAMRRVIELALGPVGNLSEEAKAVYREARHEVERRDTINQPTNQGQHHGYY